MTTTYFTSDLHLGHKRLHETYQPNRKARWATVEDMNQGILDMINSRVKETDILWHLGDLSFMKAVATKDWLSKIRCRTVNLITGNHDSFDGLSVIIEDINKEVGFEKFFIAEPQVNLYFGKKLLVLNHFPLEAWENSHHGSYHVHGHMHGNLPPRGRRLDVGLDSKQVNGSDLQIYSFDELDAALSKMPVTPKYGA